MPPTEEILAQMSNAMFFTKVNANSAYWQMPVDDESSKLLTSLPMVAINFSICYVEFTQRK